LVVTPPLQLLADENVPFDVVSALRAEGFDVEWFAESAPGTVDESVLRHASTSGRVLLTLDKDFGDLVFNRGHTSPSGVILMRGRPHSLLDILVALLRSDAVLVDNFTVVEQSGRVRSTRIHPQS